MKGRDFLTALVVQALVSVVALVVLNAARDSWSLVVNGVVSAAAIGVGLALLRSRARR